MPHQSRWFDVERIADGCLQFTEGHPVLPCHMVVFHGDDHAVLVDTGVGIGDLSSAVREVIDGDVRVVLTHSHWDHIGAAHQFEEVGIHGRELGSGGRVAIDVLSDEFASRPREFIRNYRQCGHAFPDGFAPDSYDVEPIDGVSALEPWDQLDVGGRTLELVPVPGHSPGQLAVLDRATGVCHGADVLEPGGEIFAHFRHSNLDAYQDAVRRLVELRDEGAFDTLTTGHGTPLRGGELSLLDDVLTAFDRIAGGAPYELIETNFGQAREYDIEDVRVLTRDEP